MMLIGKNLALMEIAIRIKSVDGKVVSRFKCIRIDRTKKDIFI